MNHLWKTDIYWTVFWLTMMACSGRNVILEPGSTTAVEIRIEEGNGHRIPVRFLISLPPAYDPDTPWPLLVALHGGGGMSTPFHDLWKPVTDASGVILITPQGDEWVDGIGRSWGRNAERIIAESLNWTRQRAFVHPGRILITGFSAGGSAAYRIGLTHPELFWGIAPLCSRFDIDSPPWIPPESRPLNVYIGCGEEDPSIQNARETVHLLREMGMNADLHVYKNTGHALPEPVNNELEHILNWFIAASGG